MFDSGVENLLLIKTKADITVYLPKRPYTASLPLAAHYEAENYSKRSSVVIDIQGCSTDKEKPRSFQKTAGL
jgi:hypothetical protein